tara:strand:- start:97 stop:540 length:444 start_codon:yes stop_codon:yes gene_type:complete
MPGTAFRTKVEETATPEPTPIAAKVTRSGNEEKQEVVPYLDYETKTGHPYAVEYFKLGDTWEDPVGGFPKELSVIEEYMQKQIEAGELANSVNAIRKKYAEIETITGANKDERAVVKVETIAAYVKFLMETDKIKVNLRRYGKYGNN